MDLTKKQEQTSEESQNNGNRGGTSHLYDQIKIIIFNTIYFLMHLPDELIVQYRISLDQLLLNIRRDRVNKVILSHETATISSPHQNNPTQDIRCPSSLLSRPSEDVTPRYSPVTPVGTPVNIVPQYSPISPAEPLECSSPLTETSHPKPGQTSRHNITPYQPPAQSKSATRTKNSPSPELELHRKLKIPTLIEYLNRNPINLPAPKPVTDLGVVPNFSPYYMGHRAPPNPVGATFNSIHDFNLQNRRPLLPYVPWFALPYPPPYMPHIGPITTSTNVRHPSITEYESSLTRHSRQSSEEQNAYHKSISNYSNVRPYPNFFDPRLFNQYYGYPNNLLSGAGQNFSHVVTTSSSIRPNTSSTENNFILPNIGPTYFNQQTHPLYQTPNLRPVFHQNDNNSRRSHSEILSDLLTRAPSGSSQGTSGVGTIPHSLNVTSKKNSSMKPPIRLNTANKKKSDPRLRQIRVRTFSSTSSESTSSPREHNLLNHHSAYVRPANRTVAEYTPRLPNPYQDFHYPQNPTQPFPFAKPKKK